MVIIISYNKQTWNEYNDSQTADENLANGAIISADRLNNMETGISNNDINKVTDNKNGTEQLNGVQVQPYNKLSDTIGGRNVLLGTQVDNVISPDTSNWNLDLLHPTTLVPGKVYTISAEVTLTGSSDSLASIHVNGPDANTVIVGTDSFPADGNRHSWSFTCPTSTTIFGIMIYAGVTEHTAGIGATWHHIKIEQGTIATGWTPAPEDKVNVTDTSNWQKNKVTNDDGTAFVNLYSSEQDLSATLMSLSTGLHTVYVNSVVQNSPFSGTSSAKGVVDIQANAAGNTAFGEGFLIGINKGIVMYHVWLDGSKANYTKIANDSTVAHLSGANNFDTVPTYGTNNKPFAINDTGATTARPTGQAVGYQYFDTTLNKPIWYNGANWVDSTGTTV